MREEFIEHYVGDWKEVVVKQVGYQWSRREVY